MADGTGRDDALVIADEQPGRYTLASWRNVGLFVWRAPVDAQAADALAAVCARLNQGSPSGYSGVHLFSESFGLPDAEARRKLQATMALYGKTPGCMAVVILGGGFLVSALQSLITGIRMISGPSPPLLRFARDPSELRGWFPHEHRMRTGERIEELRLMAHIHDVLALGNTPKRR